MNEKNNANKGYEKLSAEDIKYLCEHLNDELKLLYERKVKRMKLLHLFIYLLLKKENIKNKKKDLKQKENKDNILIDEFESLNLNDLLPINNKEEFENTELKFKKDSKK